MTKSVCTRVILRPSDYPEAMSESTPLKRVLKLKEIATRDLVRAGNKVEYIRYINGTIADIQRSQIAPKEVVFDVLMYPPTDYIYFNDEWN